MRGENLEKKWKVLGAFLLVSIFLFSFISAGVGIKWDQQSVIVQENKKACITYYVYNPWEKDVYAKIDLSDELKEIILSYESERKFIPAQTSSAEALPTEFCFKSPRTYEKDCWIGNILFCKQECGEEMKIYSGEVEAIEISEAEFKKGGTGGSATQMSVSAPIKVGVQCIAHDRNLSLIYIVVVLIAGTLLTLNIIKRRKNKNKENTKIIKSKKNK